MTDDKRFTPEEAAEEMFQYHGYSGPCPPGNVTAVDCTGQIGGTFSFRR